MKQSILVVALWILSTFRCNLLRCICKVHLRLLRDAVLSSLCLVLFLVMCIRSLEIPSTRRTKESCDSELSSFIHRAIAVVLCCLMQNLAAVSRKVSGPFVNAKSFYTGNQLINAVHSLLRVSILCVKSIQDIRPSE